MPRSVAIEMHRSSQPDALYEDVPFPEREFLQPHVLRKGPVNQPCFIFRDCCHFRCIVAVE